MPTLAQQMTTIWDWTLSSLVEIRNNIHDVRQEETINVLLTDYAWKNIHDCILCEKENSLAYEAEIVPNMIQYYTFVVL